MDLRIYCVADLWHIVLLLYRMNQFEYPFYKTVYNMYTQNDQIK